MKVPSVEMFQQFNPGRQENEADPRGGSGGRSPDRDERAQDDVRISAQARVLSNEKTIRETVLTSIGTRVLPESDAAAAIANADGGSGGPGGPGGLVGQGAPGPVGSATTSGVSREPAISPRAIAGRIAAGITGPIYLAFGRSLRSAAPKPSDLARFREEVARGFEEGLAEAKRMLSGVASVGPELDTAIAETAREVAAALEIFFANESERLG